MNHVATITKPSVLTKRPFHAQCSCGTGGDFATKEEAAAYLNGHGNKSTALSAVSSFELVDNSDKPIVAAALPSTHAPTAHAAASVSKVPSPPPPAPLKPAAAPAKK